MASDEFPGDVNSDDATAWLTSRQAEVLRLAEAGLVAKEIARRLGISIRTVEGHFAAMRQRTGARNMAELAAWGAARSAAQCQARSGDTRDTADAEAHP